MLLRYARARRLFGLLVGLAICTGALAQTEAPVATGRPAATTEVFGWSLTAAKVVNEGQTSTIPQGIITKGYSTEADAVSLSKDSPFNKGRFRLTLSVFSPHKDMPGQKAGMYYIRGDWTITDSSMNTTPSKARHAPGVIRGVVLAELAFNPTESKGQVSAFFRMPATRIGASWARGDASFIGNEKFEGIVAGEVSKLSARQR